MRRLVKLCKDRQKERETTGGLNPSHTFSPSVSHCLSTLHSSLISYLFCAAHFHPPCLAISCLLSAQRSLTLSLSLSLSEPLLSLSTSCCNTSTCSEVAAEYNISAYLHLNVNLNCVGCWRCWYTQQLCAAMCVWVCHRRGSEILKVNAAIFSSSSSLVILIYH